MLQFSKLFKPIFCASLLLIAASCTKGKKFSKNHSSGHGAGASHFGKTAAEDVYHDLCSESCSTNVMAITHFDFDKSDVLPESKKIIDDHVAKCVKHMLEEHNHDDKKSEKKILITGYCDKRGTKEYNIALGARRADETKSYLLNQLVLLSKESDANCNEKEAREKYNHLICVASKGKEELVDQGDTELAHAKNRRTTVEVVDECN